MKYLQLVACAIIVLAPQAVAQGKALKPTEGAVAFSFAMPSFGSWKPVPSLTFAAYDPTTHRLVEGGATSKTVMQSKDFKMVTSRLQPGDYVLREVYLYAGASSAYCFGPGTLEFRIEPGRVTYLGELSFEPASGPPRGALNAVLGNNGVWLGRVVHSSGDLAVAAPLIAARVNAPLLEKGATAATFETTGRPRSEIGRDCSQAKPLQ
jgi:hypothetical protein